MSSPIASASRKTFKPDGTRAPNTESAATANAMSVAIGTPQPRIVGSPQWKTA
jgi:hypothetical protein